MKKSGEMGRVEEIMKIGEVGEIMKIRKIGDPWIAIHNGVFLENF